MSTNITKATGTTMTSKKQFETIDNGLLVRAPAKINLSLLVVGKCPDGFHELETIMAKVDFFDEILIEPGQKPGIELICKGPHWSPEGEKNLIYPACKLLLDNCRRRADIKLTLIKNIPAGSGLGSASSDAAATLIGVKKFLQLALSKDKISELAAELGSDVAFFLDGPLALCMGRGEKIKKLDENFNFSALLMLPDVTVSTKEVYANYRHKPAIYENFSARINSYIQKNRIDLVLKMCANMLQISSFDLYKELAELKAKVESLGIGPCCLTGSGAAMFCILDSRDTGKAPKYQRQLEEKFGCESVIVSNNKW
jgi:4-diphosphocytidyl-2-C-methyl-D-erythritol kinase